MKKIYGMIALLLVLSSFMLSAQQNIAVVYHKMSAVNREAFHYIRTEAPGMGSSYTFSPVKAGTTIDPGEYDAVILLNTGRTKGIDPVLAEIMNSWGHKESLILLSLVKNSTDLQVQTVSAMESANVVDAVSAASRWKGSGFSIKTSDVRKMHQEWLGILLSLLDSKL